MTNNKPNDVRVVPVELLERLCMRPRKDSLAVNHQDIIDRGQAQAELRDILAQPADQQGEPFGYWCEPHGLPHLGIFNKTVEPNGGSHCNVVPLYRHAQPATAKVDERAAFEEEYLNNYLQIPKEISHHFFRLDMHGDYVDRQTRGGWMMWQARAKLNTPQ